jgi:hypothetical protein
MSKIVLSRSSETNESHSLTFSGGTIDQIADKAALYMAARGYHLESGSKTQGVYGKGSTAARIMLGPLSKRAKFNLTVAEDSENVTLVVAKGMSGMSGGLIGASQIKKELSAITSGIQGAILS